MELNDELEALQSIYSHKDEFSVSKDKDGNHVLSFLLTSQNTSDKNLWPSLRSKVSLSVTLSASYPTDAPRISISSNDLRRESQNKMTEELRRFTNTLPAELMVMEIICWVQEHLPEYAKRNDLNDQSGEKIKELDQLSYAVLHIDHMRSKQKYVKTLRNWADASHLRGRVIFCHHLIFVVLVGKCSNIKEFILNLKTQTLDVDSSGRNCKEKMMSVVSEGTAQGKVEKGSFESLECIDVGEVEEVFRDLGLENIFRTSVLCYFPRTAKDTSKR